MTWWLVGGIAYVLMFAFALALCRAAARADEMIAEMQC